MTTAVDSPVLPDFAQVAEQTKLLPETDGVPLETPWHHAAISLLIELLTHLWSDRDDFYVGGNMFLYNSLRRTQKEDFKGPDFFYASGVERQRQRESWIIWEENGKYPDLIVEFLSRTTAETDRTTKKELYEKTFRTPEYFLFDPSTNRLEGWRLTNGVYQEIVPDERGWMWSEVLKLWLGTWTGEYLGQTATWLRFYDPAGKLILLRAEAAEAELARLKEWLAQKGLCPTDQSRIR